MYSICAGLTDASTCKRALFASAKDFQVSSRFSPPSATGTASMLFFAMDAIDLINKLSALARSMPSISITEAPRRSSNFAVSSFSLKERENAFERANCFMVTSQTRTSFIISPCSCLYMFIWFLHFWVVRSRFRVSRFTLRAHQAFAVCAVLRFSLLRSSCSSFCDTSVRA